MLKEEMAAWRWGMDISCRGSTISGRCFHGCSARVLRNPANPERGEPATQFSPSVGHLVTMIDCFHPDDAQHIPCSPARLYFCADPSKLEAIFGAHHQLFHESPVWHTWGHINGYGCKRSIKWESRAVAEFREQTWGWRDGAWAVCGGHQQLQGLLSHLIAHQLTGNPSAHQASQQAFFPEWEPGTFGR